jgi:tetratricopeptide (TPR) repeat protein
MVRRLSEPKTKTNPLEDCVGLVSNLQSAGLDSLAEVSRILNSVRVPRLSNLSCTAMDDESISIVELEATDGSKLIVGSTIRAPLPNHPKFRRKAIIATIQEDDGTVCVFWEDEAPSSLLSADREMVVSPSPSENNENPGVESTVRISDILPLLDFERDASSDDADVSELKDRGDTLLRLGDASGAVPLYERALELMGSSPQKITIGSVAIVKQKGFFKLVQVDCIDLDRVDVTHLDVEEREETLRLSDIMLAIPKRDGKLIQERILLNLARCFLQLAEATLIPRRRPSYLKAGVRATSFAFAVSEFRSSVSSANFSSATKPKALLLRSQAQLGLSKFAHARGDAKKALELDPNNKEASKLLRDIEKQQQKMALADKKLAKEVCRWVQTATTESSVSDRLMNEPHEHPVEVAGVCLWTFAAPRSIILWITALTSLLLAWIVQKAATR